MRPYLHVIAEAAVGRSGPRSPLGYRWFVYVKPERRRPLVLSSRGAPFVDFRSRFRW